MVGLAELWAFSGCLCRTLLQLVQIFGPRRYLRISGTLREYPAVVATMTGLQMLTEEIK